MLQKDIAPPKQIIRHEIAPVYDTRSKILILGTMPSPQSRRQGFFYGHPQNRFWKTLSAVLDDPAPDTPGEKRAYLLRHRIALWDVLASCEIRGADDASIRQPEVNDFSRIFAAAPVEAVFTTGKKAFSLYKKYCFGLYPELPVQYLPSTSPANQGRFGLDSLVEHYRVILRYL